MKTSKYLLLAVLSSGLLLSSCGTNKEPSHRDNSPVPPAEMNLSYEEIMAAYNAREEAPYNHVNYVYADGVSSMQEYKVYEDKVDGNWVVDTTKTEGGIDSSPLSYLMAEASIDKYGSLPEGFTLTCKKIGEDKYSYDVSGTNNNITINQHILVDRYFCLLEAIQKADGEEVIKIVDVNWTI